MLCRQALRTGRGQRGIGGWRNASGILASFILLSGVNLAVGMAGAIIVMTVIDMALAISVTIIIGIVEANNVIIRVTVAMSLNVAIGFSCNNFSAAIYWLSSFI